MWSTPQAEANKVATSGTLLVLCVLLGVALRGWLRHSHTIYWAVSWVPYSFLSALPMGLAPRQKSVPALLVEFLLQL